MKTPNTLPILFSMISFFTIVPIGIAIWATKVILPLNMRATDGSGANMTGSLTLAGMGGFAIFILVPVITYFVTKLIIKRRK
jgi:hypothetical protein